MQQNRLCPQSPESPFLFQISNPEPALTEVAYAGTALTFGKNRCPSVCIIRGFDVCDAAPGRAEDNDLKLYSSSLDATLKTAASRVRNVSAGRLRKPCLTRAHPLCMQRHATIELAQTGSL